MGDVVNLRQARKRRERADKAAVAAGNRAAHGATKAERRRAASETTAIARALDGAKRTDRSTDGPDA